MQNFRAKLPFGPEPFGCELVVERLKAEGPFNDFDELNRLGMR